MLTLKRIVELSEPDKTTLLCKEKSIAQNYGDPIFEYSASN